VCDVDVLIVPLVAMHLLKAHKYVNHALIRQQLLQQVLLTVPSVLKVLHTMRIIPHVFVLKEHMPYHQLQKLVDSLAPTAPREEIVKLLEQLLIH
jgi:hypothetical protein